MKQFNNIAVNAIFALQVLLLFLVLFESKISLPPLAQIFGRMHPLFLHLPIGFLLTLGLLPLLRGEVSSEAFVKIQGFLLHLTSLTAVATALFGLFLAQEGGYGEGLARHKWTGVGLSWLTYALLLIHIYRPENKRWLKGGLIASLILILFTGHYGANLTHGKGYLLAPLKKEQAIAFTEQSTVYEAAVQPILKQKCFNCHNERKSKGDLVMTSLEKILAGGENGPIWTSGDAAGSSLIQRVNLPQDHEEHMPPEGKPQLTPSEIQLLHTWIQAGANTNQTIGELNPEDSLRQLVNPILKVAAASTTSKPRYTFKPASKELIESLNNPFRSVSSIAANSPALQASIFVRQTYEDRYLEELSAVKEQLVSLNLTNLPIKDQDIQTIAQFRNLEELILNGTDIQGETLADLSAADQLRSLALSNTQIDAKLQETLPKLTALQELYLWNTQLTVEEINNLQQQFPQLKIHSGYRPDPEEKLELSAPILKNKERVLAADEKIVLKHNFPGAVVRYTTDGSEPDSLRSPVYEAPFAIENFTTLKTKAYRDGWLSSPIAEYALFEKGLPVDSVVLLETPSPQYTGKGGATLNDNVKGEPRNFRNGAWLGYQDSPFSALFYLDDPKKRIEKVIVSYLQSMGSHIMPPVYIEVWGGDRPDQLRLLNKISPKAPNKYQPNAVKTLSLEIEPSSYRCYKVIAERVKSLPAWHSNPKAKGWVFVDEVFFY